MKSLLLLLSLFFPVMLYRCWTTTDDALNLDTIPTLLKVLQMSDLVKYEPICQALEPASIPQIVANIQDYLANHPIPSESDWDMLALHVENLEDRVAALEERLTALEGG